MINRSVTALLQHRLSLYPAVVLVGPRQCGKTTLSQSIGQRYFDLEQETDQVKLDFQWHDICQQNGLTVLDEVQAFPGVFPLLRGAIDRERKRNGRFLLIGSVSPFMMKQVAESLAGRLSVIQLTPFLIDEVADIADWMKLWLCGGFPDGGILVKQNFPVWQTDYMRLLEERDLPNWGMPARAQTIHRMIQMLAISNGQEWNASQIAKSMSVTYHTANNYLDYIEGAFLVRRMPAYSGNMRRKRLVKRPKIYWRDSGLLHAILNIESLDDLLIQPWVGSSWEGFVINQALNELHSRGIRFEYHHLRTSDQQEIDLVLQIGSELLAVEVKLTSNPNLNDLAKLNRTADLIDADRRILVCRVEETIESELGVICNVKDFLGLICR